MNVQTKAQLVEGLCERFTGNVNDLEKAVGILFIGQHFGWKVLYLVHDKKTLRKYEELLGLEFRELFPERGQLAHKSVALNLADEIGNFWKAVKGELTGVRTPNIT